MSALGHRMQSDRNGLKIGLDVAKCVGVFTRFAHNHKHVSINIEWGYLCILYLEILRYTVEKPILSPEPAHSTIKPCSIASQRKTE